MAPEMLLQLVKVSNSFDLEEMDMAMLDLLLEDKNIFETTQAFKVSCDALKVSMESNDEDGMKAAAKGAGAPAFKLQMLLLEKIRYFAFSVHLIKSIVCTTSLGVILNFHPQAAL